MKSLPQQRSFTVGINPWPETKGWPSNGEMTLETIKILHIALTDHMGGIETFLLNLYRNIDRERFRFDFISQSEHPAFEEQFQKLGAHIFPLPFSYRRPNRYCRDLAKIIRSGCYRIVHIHKNSAADLLPFLVCRRLGIKTVIAHAHNTSSNFGTAANLLHGINKQFLPLLYTDAFACSRPAAEWLFPRSKLGKVKIIKNGINADVYAFRPEIRGEVRRRMKLTNRFVVGHVGRFVSQKNHGFLIDIFHSVYQKNPRAILMLVGAGKLESAIQAKARQLGIENSVLFLGERSDIPRLMQAMDVFVLPSLYEGLSIASVEAQAAGLPCVISDTVTKEIALTDSVKFLSLSEPPEIWAERILKLGRNENRNTGEVKIHEAGYDITKTAEYLEKFYLQRDREYLNVTGTK